MYYFSKITIILLNVKMGLGAVHLLRDIVLAYSRLPSTPCKSVIFSIHYEDETEEKNANNTEIHGQL